MSKQRYIVIYDAECDYPSSGCEVKICDCMDTVMCTLEKLMKEHIAIYTVYELGDKVEWFIENKEIENAEK